MVMTLRCLGYGWIDKWNYHTWGKVTSALVSYLFSFLIMDALETPSQNVLRK